MMKVNVLCLYECMTNKCPCPLELYCLLQCLNSCEVNRDDKA